MATLEEWSSMNTRSNPTESLEQRAKSLFAQKRAIEEELREIGHKLPPARFSDLVRDCALDFEFERGVRSFINERMNGLDIRKLVGDEPDYDKWEIVEDGRDEDSRLGFPWAWNWSFQPEDGVHTDDLIAAGFTVAIYEGERYAGIDGCGYSFVIPHYAPLFARHCQRYNIMVPTESGPRHIIVAKDDE